MYCTKGKKVEVLESATGYYIGTLDYCRISDCYYETSEAAQEALDNLEFPFRYNAIEIQYCSFGYCILTGEAKGIN